MDRLLDRLRIETGEADERTPAASDSSEAVEWRHLSDGTTAEAVDRWDVGESSERTIEWRDISIQPDTDKPAATTRQSSPKTNDTDQLETLGTERLLTAVLDGIMTPAMITNSKGRVAYLNDAAFDLFETTEPAAVGRATTDLHDGVPLVSKVLATGNEVFDYREQVTVGTTRYTLSRTVVPFVTEAGAVIGAMETIRGRTE